MGSTSNLSQTQGAATQASSQAGALSAAGAGVGAITTAVGAYNQSAAYARQGKYSRRMANINASMADIEATDAIRRGDIAANRQGLRTALLIGTQRATAAGQGVDVNSGSALDLQANAARMGVLDQHTLRMNAYKEAMSIRMKGSSDRFQGNMAYMSGRNNAYNSLLAGGLNGTRQVSSALDNYYKYRPPMSLTQVDGQSNDANSSGDEGV